MSLVLGNLSWGIAMIQNPLPDTISFLISVNVHMFSQLLSLYLWDPCCIPCCTCNLEACNKVYYYNSWVFHIPMKISISHSYDAKRDTLSKMGIRPSISKSLQPATFQCQGINTLRPRQNGRHFPDDIFKCIFLDANVWISVKISLKIVPEVRIYNIPALVQIMAWRRPGAQAIIWANDG